jgi:polysaccharide export outer membrane protein
MRWFRISFHSAINRGGAMLLAVTAGALAFAQSAIDGVPQNPSFFNQLAPNRQDPAQSGLAPRSDQSPYCLDEYGYPADCSSVNGRYSPLGAPGIDGYPNSSMPQYPSGATYYNPTYPSGASSNDPLHNSPQSQTGARYRVREPLTEFQRYVATSIGQVLPIFGASLFEQVPATFAPNDRIPVSPDYVIGPGDELQVTTWGQINFSRHLLVDPSGQVYLPDVGQIAVAGLKYADATPALRTNISRVYRNFDLSVTLGRLRSIQIFVVGEARRPGSYTVSSLSTLVNAVFASGGPSARGSMRSIELKRGDQTIRHFDLYDLLLHGDKSKDAALSPGDVILIPAAGTRAAIAGSIEHPGIYELASGTTLGAAIQLAGGISPVAAAHEVVIERVADGAALEVRRVALTPDGLATELRNGDIIRLLPVIPRFENAVTLRGNVADPGRFPWRPGMRVSDLIPDQQVLLTREYWSERNRLTSVDPSKSDPSKNSNSSPDTPAFDADGQPVSPVKPGFDPLAQTTDRALTGSKVLFREQARNTQGDSSLGAATADDGPPLRNFLPQNVVQPSAPEVNWDYAVIERLDTQNLTTHLIPFNLGKVVLHHDVAEDLPLQPGDVVTIFSKADVSVPQTEQTKQVRLEGEVAMAGVYTAHPGDTLRSIVARAGGLTSSAYLYGAQFTRESTRRTQQKRYDDFLNQLEKDVNQGAANLSGRVISTEQAATAQASITSQRELIDRLRQVPINGRIVLDLDPTSKGVTALPDVPLENGDRLYVPSRPLTMSVVGSVYEQAAFLYDEDLKVGDYLKKAGGPSRSADRSHMFVIRADGSVVARSTSVHPFGRSFDSLPVHPGDTLVVPTYINRTTFVRGLMDWSQIFSNLALGAAAVNVLH